MLDGDLDAGPSTSRSRRPLVELLDERSALAIGAVLAVMGSYILCIVVLPAAFFLLRHRIGSRAAIWGALGSAGVGGVLALGSAWQWWKASGQIVSDYQQLSSLDLSSLPQVGPLVAAVVVIVLCIGAMNRRSPTVDDEGLDETDDSDTEADAVEEYRPFERIDLVVILITLAYLLTVQPYWFF